MSRKRREPVMGVVMGAAAEAAETQAAAAVRGVELLEQVPMPFFGPEVEVADGDYVTVNRLDERLKQWVLQFKLTPEETSETYIQEIRGGGHYRIRLEGRDAMGRRIFKAQRTIDLDGPVKPLMAYPTGKSPPTGPATVGTAAVGAAAAAAGDGEHFTFDKMMMATMMDMFRASKEQNAVTLEAVKTAQQRVPAEDGAMVRVLDAIVQNQAKSEAAQQRMFEVLLAMVNKPPPPLPPAVDPLVIVDRMAALMKPSQTLKDQIESLNGLYDLKDRINPEGEPEDPIVKLVETNLPKVLSVIEKMGGKATAPVVTPKAPAPGAIAPKSGAAAPAAEPAPDGSPGMWQVYVAKKLPILLRWAARDKNARVLAAAEYELLPDEIRGPFRAFLAEPGAIAKIVTLEPQLAAYTNDAEDGWLDLFVDQLMGEFGLFEEEGEDEEVEPDAANAGRSAAPAPAAGAGAAGPGPRPAGDGRVG